jgi:hypothetical protein
MSDALELVAEATMVDRAKQLGIAHKGDILAESDHQMRLVWDLAIHTAKPGRSRAIDRCVKAKMASCDPEVAKALAAMQAARFSLWEVERYHPVAGLILTDVVTGDEVWFMDEAMTATAELGSSFAARLYQPAEFMMTCLLIVPFDENLLLEIMAEAAEAKWALGQDKATITLDPRFAALFYRVAIRQGVMERVLTIPSETAQFSPKLDGTAQAA